MVSAGCAKWILFTTIDLRQRRIRIPFKLHIRSRSHIQVVLVGSYRTTKIALLQQFSQVAEQSLVQLLNLCPASAPLPALVLKRLAARVVEEKIFGRKQLKRPNKLMVEDLD